MDVTTREEAPKQPPPKPRKVYTAYVGDYKLETDNPRSGMVTVTVTKGDKDKWLHFFPDHVPEGVLEHEFQQMTKDFLEAVKAVVDKEMSLEPHDKFTSPG